MLFLCQSSWPDPSNKNQYNLNFEKLKKKDELVADVIFRNKKDFNILTDSDGKTLVWKRITQHSFHSLLSVTVRKINFI